MSKIKVVDVESETVLFECELNESEKAYEYAAEMEKLGLDVIIKNPTVTQTLSESLGISTEDSERLEEELAEEIEGHNCEPCDIKKTASDGSNLH
jgi:hypothetical protein